MPRTRREPPDLGFEIYVNTNLTEEQLLRLLLYTLPGATRDGGYILACNCGIKFENNFDFDPLQARTADDSWAFYRYHCDVFPIGETTVVKQVHRAITLRELFHRIGGQTELCADF